MSKSLESVTRKMWSREEVGRAKYGATVDRTDLSLFDWLTHLQEELMDGALYCEAALRRLEDKTQ